MFDNCLVDGLLISIVQIFKHHKRRHSLLQRHLEYIMHIFAQYTNAQILLFDLNVEIKGLEFYQIKRKWLFVGTYKPIVVNYLQFTKVLIEILYHFSSNYGNLLIIGDLDIESIENFHLNTLLNC